MRCPLPEFGARRLDKELGLPVKSDCDTSPFVFSARIRVVNQQVEEHVASLIKSNLVLDQSTSRFLAIQYEGLTIPPDVNVHMFVYIIRLTNRAYRAML